jgi:hypothetical protein
MMRALRKNEKKTCGTTYSLDGTNAVDAESRLAIRVIGTGALISGFTLKNRTESEGGGEGRSIARERGKRKKEPKQHQGCRGRCFAWLE